MKTTIRETWLRFVARFGNEPPEGILGRYDRRGDYIKVRLETRRGEHLRVRVETKYFERLGLKRGDQIIIIRYETRAENGQQYIQALAVRRF